MSVSAKEEVIIKDACVFFDLIDLELLDCFYKLELTVITTPEVIAEITDDSQLNKIRPYIDNGNLQIDSFGEFDIIRNILDNNPRLSLPDAAVLEAASRKDAAILSSDKSLRNEANRRGIMVKGLLWVLEELHNQKVIELSVLLEKLRLYSQVNQRAPKSEIENLIIKYLK
jgi:rRNA-processing protein FCF1